MNFLRNKTLKQKLIIIIMVTCGLTLITSCTAFIINDYFSSRKIFKEELSSIARVVGANSISSLEFNDPSVGKDILEALRQYSRIDSAALYSVDGDLFAFYHSSVEHEFSGPLSAEEFKKRKEYGGSRSLSRLYSIKEKLGQFI